MNQYLNFSLEGKVALVTGASYGIGFAIATSFGKAGATIVFNDIKQELVDKGLAAYEAEGIKAHGYVCDVTNEEHVNAFVAKVEKEVGVIDILVNNAGITRDNLIMRMTDQEFEDVLNTNLKGAFYMIRSLSRNFLKQRSGKIINITSVVGITGNAGQANYSASKAGVIGLTKSVAREFASRGICVNAVAPGYIETEMTQALSEDAAKSLLQMIPMGKAGTAQNVADLVLFLAGSGSDYITGQVIGVNGGMAMQ